MDTTEQEKKPVNRGDRTREKIIDSAIASVAEGGYSRTTVQAVLDRSGVSRGSLLHQFPTRNELMMATARAALQKMLASIQGRISSANSPLEGLFCYPDSLWEAMLEPPALALYNIQMASRWDVEMRDGLRKAVSDAENYIEATVRSLGRKYEMKDIDGYLIDLSVINDAFPNLVARRELTSNPERIKLEREKLRVWHTEALNSRIPKQYQMKEWTRDLNGGS